MGYIERVGWGGGGTEQVQGYILRKKGAKKWEKNKVGGGGWIQIAWDHILLQWPAI